jgi:SAM-dependent methyltransferase
VKIEPGDSTAHPFNVHYRIGRIANYLDGGDWLDYGCADGGYTHALLESGAKRAIGIDVDVNRIEAARQAFPNIDFYARPSQGLPFKPGGLLIIISPNRGFPFEGHTAHIGRWSSKAPTPLVPWLPKTLSGRWVTARNYWPGELSGIVSSSAFAIVESGFIMPVFEGYPLVPPAVAEWFRGHITVARRHP